MSNAYNPAYQLVNFEGKLNEMQRKLKEFEIRLRLLELEATKDESRVSL